MMILSIEKVVLTACRTLVSIMFPCLNRIEALHFSFTKKLLKLNAIVRRLIDMSDIITISDGLLNHDVLYVFLIFFS